MRVPGQLVQSPREGVGGLGSKDMSKVNFLLLTDACRQRKNKDWAAA